METIKEKEEEIEQESLGLNVMTWQNG